MIAFEVVVNGEKACVAGIDDLGVLTALLTWVHRVPRVDNDNLDEYPTRELTLDIHGLQSARSNQPDEQLSWLHCDLTVGDTVTLHIKDLQSVDEPESRVPALAKTRSTLSI